MSAWLDELRHVLDAAPQPIVLFFRDDDAGWADARLFALLDLFARRALPLDVAAIPCALTPATAAELRARAAAAHGLLALHQHGFAHLNHEPAGRSCEFGGARTRAAQRQDIESGRRLLTNLLELPLAPLFTPPWNRCNAMTGDCLRELGFQALSRDVTARPLGIAGLCELPITVDWFARHKGVRLSLAELGGRLAAAARARAPVGIMFHHALMDAAELSRADELLALLAAHGNVRCRTMPALLDSSAARAAPRRAAALQTLTI